MSFEISDCCGNQYYWDGCEWKTTAAPKGPRYFQLIEGKWVELGKSFCDMLMKVVMERGGDGQFLMIE